MASSDQFIGGTSGGPRYVQMQSEPSTPQHHQQQHHQSMLSSFFSFTQGVPPEATRIFDELPTATIVSVSRPDAGDISPVLLSYTIEVQYKQARIHLFNLIFFPINEYIVLFFGSELKMRFR